jgi:hypothetical protein
MAYGRVDVQRAGSPDTAQGAKKNELASYMADDSAVYTLRALGSRDIGTSNSIGKARQSPR